MPFPRLRARPVWQQDLLIALATWLIGMLVYLTGIHRVLAGFDHAPLWVRLVELTVLCALQPLRRRVPAGLLLATAVLAADIAVTPSLPVLIVYTDFLYAATLYGSRRTSRVMIGVAAASTAIVLAAVLVLVHEWHAAVVAALGVLPFVLTPVWWATNVRQQRDIAESERANAGQLAKLAELDRRAAVTAERGRMARDLHDVIAGHLSAIAIQSEAALSMPDPKLSRRVLESVRENSVSALEEMRAMIGLLRAEGGEDETTAPARLAELSKLVESARASGLDVTVKSTVDDPALPAAADLTAYRIAQEALTNAVKHAPGRRVDVDIRWLDGILTVEVENEVHHRPPAAAGTGTGLLNMRERADALGGTLTAGPAGAGWLVRAELPAAGGAIVTVKVLVADDHSAIRAGLTLILDNAEGIEVVGEAADGAAAVRQARALRPDVVLMDVRMPGTDGITATRELIAAGLCEVLVLTTFDLDEYVDAALRAGAAGFLLKSVDAPRLIEAVKQVAAGEGVLAPQVTRRVLTAFAASARDPAAAPAGLDELTDREREVLGCLGAGLSNAQIGTRLHIGETTVKTHVSRVLTKLNLRSRVQAAILAQENDLVRESP